ncbi:MAG: DUF2851 family protein [Bacteroidales bacterium]|nr:DUF2851 family protein [Bacteroidales bacterium]
MEVLLHYVWKHKIFPLEELHTTSGEIVEVIDTGLSNENAGPDFFNAKIKINGTVWVGNVEIHENASDWFLHRHDVDVHYDNVILHVVKRANTVVTRADGSIIPQLELPVPSYVEDNYHELFITDTYPPCYRIVKTIPPLLTHNLIDAMQLERLQQKSNMLFNRVSHCNGNWEEAVFITLARNFGFGLNGDAFEIWANHIPLKAVDKHRDNLFQIEAFFFGQAGLLSTDSTDDYAVQLKKEYDYLAHKFQLQPMDPIHWRFARTRPNNSPHIRIAQLAYLYQHSNNLLSRIVEIKVPSDVPTLLSAKTSDYWLTHYSFGKKSVSVTKSLSKTAIHLIVINTITTILFAYGKHIGKDSLCEQALNMLTVLKPENNHITRMWAKAGLVAQHAGDSQALIQLKKEYCDHKKCLYCNLGYHYLKRQHHDE